MPEAGEYPNPYIRSGPNKGRIRNPLVAHEVNNTIEELRARETKGTHKKFLKKPFFKKYGTDEALILQAAKNVREEEKSGIDELTGLHRKESYRPFVEDHIKKLREGEIKSCGIVRLDFDHFSWVNNVVEAHQLGDIYLARAGHLLREEINKQDIAIRAGGDEFVVLFDNLKSKEDFVKVVSRVHKVLNKRVLAQTLHTLLFSDREIIGDSGKPVREGTFALKQFLTGLMNLRDDVDGKATHFLASGGGELSEKQKFLSMIKGVDFDQYKSYLADTRSLAELTAEDVTTRMIQEGAIKDLIEYVFFNLGVSAGGLYLTKDNLLGFFPIDKLLDESVYAVKRRGGGNYIIA